MTRAQSNQAFVGMVELGPQAPASVAITYLPRTLP
jgi:hypothetical protein